MNHTHNTPPRHSGAGRNPALLSKGILGFVHALRGNFFIDWIPAYAGMTTLDSGLRRNDNP